jgi:hypothetical protein
MATLFSLLAKNNHKVILSPAEEKVTEALAASGFLAGMMMTLSLPLGKGNFDEQWFRAAVGLLMRDYYTQYGVMLQYQIVMNHGWAGTGKLSAHIVWKNELPEHAGFLVSRWNKKYGVDRAVMSPHSQGLRYYVKNMSQPNALTHDGPHNRTAVPAKKRARHAGRD